ncbi:uncharacterized protein B0I36DRAFT_134542 [Microdochium trichocladiopsis]|uniref:Uncharacterized protein n=1 Tax=Microdochium trichocladiopsis TaxID=1682393 RepID=A0A9P8Y5X0_9PEZI|nr:uncharacterized protein B0I36DRAFT_134542 [Microdochium trichocladiopsis]KAH7029640.1 hypothetical protein B0I36DRAFT_134542 [Microdochium trichocladiopsis]
MQRPGQPHNFVKMRPEGRASTQLSSAGGLRSVALGSNGVIPTTWLPPGYLSEKPVVLLCCSVVKLGPFMPCPDVGDEYLSRRSPGLYHIHANLPYSRSAHRPVMATIAASKISQYGAIWIVLYGLAAIIMRLLDIVLRCAVVWAIMLLFNEVASQRHGPAKSCICDKESKAQSTGFETRYRPINKPVSHEGNFPFFPGCYPDLSERELARTLNHDAVSEPAQIPYCVRI